MTARQATLPQTRAFAVTAAASFGFSLVQLDVTMINVALPSMASPLHADLSALQWFVDAYTLAFAVMLLSGGLLADRLGARRTYLAGLALFALASAACGVAPDAPLLVAARVLQGVAAAVMLPSSLALVNHATGHDTALRARSIGTWTAAGSIAIAAGPILGGLLLPLHGWRSIFLVNLPVCALAAWLTLRATERDANAIKTGLPARGIDVPGQVLAIFALGGLTAGMIQLRPLGAAHPFVLGSFALAVLSAVAFVQVESRSARPMLPLWIFRAPNFSAAVGYGIVVNMTYYGIVFVLSLYLQRVQGYSALRTGLAYLPLTAGFFAVNLFSGWLVGRIGSRRPMIFGALIDACGFALLLPLAAGSGYWQIAPAFALIPMGMGLGVPAMTTSVLSSVDKQWSGVAAATLNAARQAGGAIGVALFGALAGDGRDGVVHGLHGAASISIGLLLMAAALAFGAIRSHAPVTAAG
jgi:DHA2 family methylenomycin A resistance protein-like MFS transporter